MEREEAFKPFLSPRDLARVAGVSESSVKRWVDSGLLSASRTAGKHRRIDRAEAIRFVRAHRMDVVEPDILGFPEARSVGDKDALNERLLTHALKEGDAARAIGMVAGWFLAGQPLHGIFDGPIRSAMDDIGELWRQRDDGVVIEHRATNICLHAITRIRLALPPSPTGGPIAVGGAPSGDPYILPSLMAAAIVRESGFADMNLGPDTPIGCLRTALHGYRPRLAWLSLSSRKAAGQSLRLLPELAEAAATTGGVLIVGGRASGGAQRAASPNVAFGDSMAELSAFARGLVASGPGGSGQARAGGGPGP